MGWEINPPTTADYAWDAVQTAKRDNERQKAKLQVGSGGPRGRWYRG